MKIYKNIVCHFLLYISIVLSVEVDNKVLNDKYSFIQDIYSESWALIIGINDYQNAPSLSYAEKDALDIKNLLKEQYGFKESNIETILNQQATKVNILKGFNDILTKAKEEDRVLIYFAGHGDTYELPSGGEMGFLIPVDGDTDNLYLSSIKMEEIYDLADMSYAKHILYLIDACYGGLTIQKRGLKKEMTSQFLRKLTAEKGRQIITAGGKDEEVIESPKWGHSAFAKNLLNGLGKNQLADENGDGIITVDELGLFVKNRVPIDVDGAHVPRYSRIGSDMGEFVFISQNLEMDVTEQDEANVLKTKEQKQKIASLLEVQNTSQNHTINDARKTATTLSYIFPGSGHFYAGKFGKGVVFSGLELSALIGIIISSNNYSNAVNEYKLYEQKISQGGDWNEIDRKQYFDRKNNTIYPLIGSSVAAGIVWVWSIWDLNQIYSSNYTKSNAISIGINNRTQIQVNIFFN